MLKKETLKRAAADKREGLAPTTQAGEFIKETMDEIREGKIGARSTKPGEETRPASDAGLIGRRQRGLSRTICTWSRSEPSA